jgi:hypothetical protein
MIVEVALFEYINYIGRDHFGKWLLPLRTATFLNAANHRLMNVPKLVEGLFA